MKRLILMRHAEPERSAPAGGDFERPLSPRGRRDAARVGRSLAAAGLVPDLALVSPARRTRETWAEASAFLPDAQVEFPRELYAAPADRLRLAAEDAEGASTVMVVAHNPGLHELAYQLAAGAALIEPTVRARLEEGFPAASAVAFELDGARIACLGLFRVRDLTEADEA